jgi:acetylornithine/succinyldiaminopimelate/putrescine aminotransferase/predicted amino acid dehydrogenase
MTILQLLQTLEARGVRLWLDHAELRYDAPKGAMSPDLLGELRVRKREIVAWLTAAAGAITASPQAQPRRLKRFDITGLRPLHSPLVPNGWEHDHPYFRYVEPYKGFLLDRLGLARRYVRGEGVWLFDEEGTRYFDCIAQHGALPFGHNPSAIWDALVSVRARGEPGYAANSPLDAAGELAERLVKLWPEAGFENVVFANSGAETVEAAIKLCRAATGRVALLSTGGGFHGLTLGALGVAGSDFYREGFGVESVVADRVPYGDVAALEEALRARPGGYAALIVEPIQGESGINEPPDGYLPRARELCDQTGTLLVFDEVQTGLGRTGDLFACQRENVVPDVMTLAKALGGGLVPIGACLYRPAARSERFGLRHSSTFAAGTLACRVGLATLDLLENNRRQLLSSVRQNGARLRKQLLEMRDRFPNLVVGISGRGYMLGVKLRFSELWRLPGLLGYLGDQNLAIHLIVSHLLNVHHIRISPSFSSGDVLRIQPPLTATQEQLDLLVPALETTLSLVASGNAIGLVGHLLGEDAHASSPTAIEPSISVSHKPEPQPPAFDASVGRFAFTVHLLSVEDLRRIDPGLCQLDNMQLELLKEQIGEYVDPFPVDSMMIRGAGGARAYGELILIPYTPADLLEMSPSKACEEVELAVRAAQARGAQIVGLGGFTSVVTQGGLALSGRGLPPITSGNSYTAAAAQQAVLAACAEREMPLSKVTLAVVGAAGMIGRAVASLFAGRVLSLILVGNPSRPELSRVRLRQVAFDIVRQLAAEAHHATPADGTLAALVAHAGTLDDALLDRLERLGRLVIDSNVAATLPRADVVVAATSSTRTLIGAEHLKADAIVCDVARPFNVDPAVRESRPDVCLIDGGLVRLPFDADSGVYAGPRSGIVYACVAETILWALEQTYDRVSPEACMEIDAIRSLERIGEKHGFVVAGETTGLLT